MSQPPSPDTRIATAPGSVRFDNSPTPATARRSTVRQGTTQRSARTASHTLCRVAALASPSLTITSARHPRALQSSQAQITRPFCQARWLAGPVGVGRILPRAPRLAVGHPVYRRAPWPFS